LCVIIDADIDNLVFCEIPHHDFLPVFNWLRNPLGNGSMVYGGKNAEELFRREQTRGFIKTLSQAGRAFLFTDEEIATEEANVVNSGLCHSNDTHVIALAKASGARTLCSHDQLLHRDFGDPAILNNPRGSIYQSARHRHLLRHTRSCTQKNT